MASTDVIKDCSRKIQPFYMVLDMVEGTMFETSEWTVLFILIQNLILFLIEQFQVFLVDFSWKRISPIGFVSGVAIKFNKVSIWRIEGFEGFMSLQEFIYSLNEYVIIVRAIFKRQIKIITFRILLDTKNNWDLCCIMIFLLPWPTTS